MSDSLFDGAVDRLGSVLSRRHVLGQAMGAGAVAAMAAAGLSRSSVSASQRGVSLAQATPMAGGTPTAGGPPTIVLVHGAFADASSWAGVIKELQGDGLTVMAPANPLRSVSGDAAYTASVVNQIPGPVLLVGHSYGGAVITNAASDAPNVVGLVYVAAFAPDEGERLGEVTPTSKDSVLNSALEQHHYPIEGGEDGIEFRIQPDRVHDPFAADLPAGQVALIAATQRPIAASAFSDVNGPPAWRHLPSWAVVATGDKAAGADLVRSMAQRAGARITEVEGSHVIMISQPDAVTAVILQAVEAVTRVPVRT